MAFTYTSLRHFRWRSWTQDYGMLLPTDVPISADVAAAVPALLAMCRELLAERPELKSRIEARSRAMSKMHDQTRARWADEAAGAAHQSPVAPAFLARELGEVIKNDDWVLTNGSLDGWAGSSGTGTSRTGSSVRLASAMGSERPFGPPSRTRPRAG